MKRKPDRTRQGGSGGARGGGSAAFTLIELLTIIVILGMLISIAAPSITAGMKIFRRDETRGRLHQLDMGLALYKQDWRDLGDVPNDLPGYLRGLPSSSTNDADSVAGGLSGRFALVQALTGYLGEGDDGKKGKGSRFRIPGKVYGPYVDLPIAFRPDPVFIDAFDHDIYYYRFHPGSGSGGYSAGDNTNVTPSGLDLSSYLQDPNGNPVRSDYVLITPGPDRVWRKTGDKKTDDITNFSFQVDNRNN